ncbi:FAD-dependent oxidoreductase [Thiolapillus brandeum]|uniref:FAD dependent oxidoreductase n=1 Tax=Thiolapillus brandeum TaxID=1076588 RepID=A0A7U6JFU0_9GAMM|nr:FAD-dependent oxidoreductase [Thiolapillus brandeum]BAO43071.1 FAD dependent oxidoreductase [Thiolapillus brandeum]
MVRPDLLIFGGGIAGLWVLSRARQAGYQALLLESRALGGVQSIASQGIIHGGTKYALKGSVTESTRTIADMPGIWRKALAGTGEVDLSGVRLLSEHQYLWSSGSLSSSMASLFASRLMQSRVAAVRKNELPPPFDVPAFRGSLYRLEEPVLDTAALMGELARQLAPYCHAYDPAQLKLSPQGLHIGEVQIRPRKVFLAAGKGNADLLQRWGMDAPRMQTRPLHMVMLKGDLPPVYAHCLGASANPRLTITTYPGKVGDSIWYLGGQLAEKGVNLGAEKQIQIARSELGKLLPWVDLSGARWATLKIDRAEVATPGGRRPEDCYLGGNGAVLSAWPTKLAFAPRLAEQVLVHLRETGIGPGAEAIASLPLPPPPLATLPWETATWS